MDNYIDEFFQKIGKGVSNRRIANDCKKIYEKYPNFVLSNDSGKVELIVNNNEENYGFVFNTSYPFQPPQIYYNGKSYLELLIITDNDERNILLKYKKRDCLCCESYNCQTNWCPSTKLTNIIDEIQSVVQLRKAIVHILLADKIKEKYLIDDIDINSFLI
jgi:ubiquitin-protein ligase